MKYHERLLRFLKSSWFLKCNMKWNAYSSASGPFVAGGAGPPLRSGHWGAGRCAGRCASGCAGGAGSARGRTGCASSWPRFGLVNGFEWWQCFHCFHWMMLNAMLNFLGVKSLLKKLTSPDSDDVPWCPMHISLPLRSRALNGPHRWVTTHEIIVTGQLGYPFRLWLPSVVSGRVWKPWKARVSAIPFD